MIGLRSSSCERGFRHVAIQPALIAEAYPDVEAPGALGEHDTLLSREKVRRLLGYRT